MESLLQDRKSQIQRSGESSADLACDKASLAGSVSQRACVFCGSRVVLYPIADAVHLIHGPIGCAAYTWDIRGSLSSGPELHRLSFSTDLQEKDVIFGGEKKLAAVIDRLIADYRPKAVFVYATCIVGVIGDDLGAICRKAAATHGIPVLAVQSEGFKGTKKDGYRAACDALLTLIGTQPSFGADDLVARAGLPADAPAINILGEFNLAGEAWMIRDYYRRMGVRVIATLTGDGRIDDIRRSNQAQLNLVQCSGSMTFLAKTMQEKYGIPYKKVSYFGIEDMAEALYEVARCFADRVDGPAIMERTRTLVREELGKLMPQLAAWKTALSGKKAAIYVGGAFKSHSLVKALRLIGLRTVLVGSQTGNAEDYRALKELCDPGTIIVDDSNPVELSRFILETGADLFIGGVKERPMAYKLGVAFCDHNHERKIALAGFAGMANFAREVHDSVLSPVWRFSPRSELLASPTAASSPSLRCSHSYRYAPLLASDSSLHLGRHQPLSNGEPEARSGLSATAETQFCKVHERPLRDSRLPASGESGGDGESLETKQLPNPTGGAGCGKGCKDEPEARSVVYRKVHEHRSEGEDAADRPTGRQRIGDDARKAQAAPPAAEDFIVSRNACKLCTPLGAALAFKGVAGAINLLHGSQGCATYIRRYLISHFREPIDIASSNFTEHTTVFGGQNNLHLALDNLMSQYQPALIGVATTCLAETIGEDLPAMLRGWTEARTAAGLPLPALVGVNTPSYIGTHREGFQATVREIVKALVGGKSALKSAGHRESAPVPDFVPNTTPDEAASTKPGRKTVNLLPGMCSPADLRWLKETATAFGLDSILLPDYSDSLDGGLWSDYQAIPAGGTSLADIGRMSQASASLELGVLPLKGGSAGSWLSRNTAQPLHPLDLPIGITLTGHFLDSLSAIAGQAVPASLQAERRRLADSYVDAHKYLAGLPVAVFGEEDFVVAMACFLAETGLKPMLCASGGKSGLMASRLPQLLADYPGLQDINIAQGTDFLRLEEQARQLDIQMAVGSSKGFKLASRLGIPLVRCGFPIHDRFGGGRLLHFGYRGAQELFDRIVNARLEVRQSADPIGYTYF